MHALTPPPGIKYRAVTRGTPCMQAAYAHISAARWEVDLYRPTHLLPIRPLATLTMLSRAVLSTATLLLYPVESGTLRLQQCGAHAEELQGAAAAFAECCRFVCRIAIVQ